MRVDRRIAVLDRVAVALALEHAPRLAVDEADERGLDDCPRLRAVLVVDAARARRNRRKERRKTLRRRAVGEPRLPHGAEAARLLLDERGHDALVGDEVGGERSELAPEAEVVASEDAVGERALVVVAREQKAHRGRRLDRKSRHLEHGEVRDRFVADAERVRESVARQRNHAALGDRRG